VIVASEIVWVRSHGDQDCTIVEERLGREWVTVGGGS